jgi:uncharacterized DUF497 family protein
VDVLCSYTNSVETTYDPAKRDWTLKHRGIDFAVDAEKVFSGITVTVADDRFDYGEVGRISAGFLDGRMVVIVWTERGTSRHIISMRYCHDKEEKRWHEILRQIPDR